MQPKLSVNSSDWAHWLTSIAQHPRQHGTLAQVGNQVLFLNAEQMRQQGRTAQKLTSKKIIQITQEMWNDPVICRTTKKQILEGLGYIHEQRKHRYQNLLWVVKVIAKWRGIEALLQDERQKITSLFQEQFVSIREQMEKLNQERARLTEREVRPRAWYENFFSLEKDLYQFKQLLPASLLPGLKPQLKELDQKADEWNQHIPRFRDIVKVFDIESIQLDLEQTLTSLCDGQVVDKELWKDQGIFQCSQLEARGHYVRRLIKERRTGLSVSLISAIEREWEKIIQTMPKEQGAITKVLEGHRVIFIPKDGEIYLKEGFINKGSYKAAFLISLFQSLKTHKDRSKFAILQPINLVIDEVPKNHDEPFDKSVDVENYRKEANYCLLYGNLPGVWPTRRVTTVDGQPALIQLGAGYPLTTVTGEETCAINLKDMIVFLDCDTLRKDDQLVLLEMIKWFLIGVNSFHTRGVIHRDLKPENVLCSDEGTAGVTDLGLVCSNAIESEDGTGSKPNPEKKATVGSPYFIAPELWAYAESEKWKETEQWEQIGLEIDIWAIGMILWEMLSDKAITAHPALQSAGNISRLEPEQVILRVAKLVSDDDTNKMYKENYKEPKEKTSLEHLIWSCTRPDPAERPAIADVIAHYERWAAYTEARMKAGAIRSIRDTFNHKVKKVR